MSRPTLQDIADSVGVTKMTVSRSLRGVGRISARTRDRVREAARNLGYITASECVWGQPAHRGKSDHSLRLLLPVMTRPGAEVTSSYSADILRGIEDRIRLNGKDGIVEPVPCSTLKEICEAWKDRRANGLIVRRLLPLRWMARLQELGPVVYAVSTDIMPDVDAVYTNEMRSAACLQRHLIKLNHTNIAWFGLYDFNAEADLPQCLFDELSPMDRSRYNVHGMRYASWEYVTQQTSSHKPLILNRDWHQESITDAVRRGLEQVLALSPRPTAIVVPSNPMAVTISQLAAEMGLSIPGDFSLVCYCNSLLTLPNKQSCASVVMPMYDVGRAIPDLIERRLADPDAMPLTLMFQANLEVGDTLIANT